MKLAVITFMFAQPRKWKQLKFDLYHAEHVNALYRACAANITIPHRFLCLTDDPTGIQCETAEVWPAIYVNGEDACYRRLHAFDAEWQRELGADFVLMLDLDAVFLGDATPVIEAAMQHDFTILRGSTWGDGTLCSYYNGSIWLCRAGARPYFWTDFNPATFYAQREAFKMPNGRRPHGSDQAWITVRAGDSERTWGPEIVQYRNLKGPIPEEARIVFFAGKSKPWAVKSESPQLYEAWARYA